MVKNPPANAGDMGLIPGSGRFPGEGNANPFRYSGLENLMDRGVWRAIVHGLSKELDLTEQLNNPPNYYRRKVNENSQKYNHTNQKSSHTYPQTINAVQSR